MQAGALVALTAALARPTGPETLTRPTPPAIAMRLLLRPRTVPAADVLSPKILACLCWNANFSLLGCLYSSWVNGTCEGACGGTGTLTQTRTIEVGAASFCLAPLSQDVSCTTAPCASMFSSTELSAIVDSSVC